MHETGLRIYIPTVVPVQAGEYRNRSSLAEFRVWVQRTRGRGFIGDGVRFMIARRGQLTVGVLRTPLGDSDMRVGDFLVFDGRAFFIRSATDFWRDYRDPDNLVTLPRSDPRQTTPADSKLQDAHCAE